MSMYDTRQGVVFDELDSRLGSIRRYNLFFTVQHQSVAAHVFNVQRIAMRIARQWFCVGDAALLLRISEWASHHDDLEALSGDILAMAKPYFDEHAFNEDNGVIYSADPLEPERLIVKLADIMECTYFLYREMSHGNLYLANHIEWMESRLLSFTERMCPDVIDQVRAWMAGAKHERPEVTAPRGPSEDRMK